jgi:hypothetical protein
MTAWTNDELAAIGAADELEIAPHRLDGTQRPPVTIWVVRTGDDLYVRSYRAGGSAWFRGAEITHEGHIRAGGVDKDVTFVDVDRGLDGPIDDAYRAKYHRFDASYVDPMVAPAAQATTLKLVPRQ